MHAPADAPSWHDSHLGVGIQSDYLPRVAHSFSPKKRLTTDACCKQEELGTRQAE